MKARLVMVLVLGVSVVALPAVAHADTARGASNTRTFQDSIGEDPAAPDITTVVVSNDDAGLITFQINVSNRPALTPDMDFEIFLDTDQNSATGSSDTLGSDYIIQLLPGNVTLFHWNGTDYVAASSQASLTYAYATTGPTIHVSAIDLGGPKAFDFGVSAQSGVAISSTGTPDFTNAHSDNAPDRGHGFNTYQVLKRLVLRVTAFTTAPKPAHAGGRLSVSLSALQNDTGGPVQAGTVSCAATIAGRRIVAVTHVVRNGVATCVWRLPATARGRFVRGLITLTVHGTSVTRGFSARVI